MQKFFFWFDIKLPVAFEYMLSIKLNIKSHWMDLMLEIWSECSALKPLVTLMHAFTATMPDGCMQNPFKCYFTLLHIWRDLHFDFKGLILDSWWLFLISPVHDVTFLSVANKQWHNHCDSDNTKSNHESFGVRHVNGISWETATFRRPSCDVHHAWIDRNKRFAGWLFCGIISFVCMAFHCGTLINHCSWNTNKENLYLIPFTSSH